MPESEKEVVPAPPRPRRKKGGGAKLLFISLVVLALAGIIVYLLSLLNSKTFFLVPEDGELVVKKGIFFPVGSELYQPPEPGLAALYAPIDLPDELKHAGPMEFDDLPSLNREFGKYLIGLATTLVFSDDEGQYKKGRAYLERVRKLHGLDPAQVDRVKSLRADVDYIEAKRAYLGVERTLERALKKFKQAETFGSGRFGDAGEWINKIETLLEAIRVTKAGVIKPLPKAEIETIPVPSLTPEDSSAPDVGEPEPDKPSPKSPRRALPPDGI